MVQFSLFPGADPKAPEGFAYYEDIVSVAEESALTAAFSALPFAPFQFHQYEGKRRVVSYGHRYNFSGHTLEPAEAMPDFLLPLREKAGAVAGVAAEDFAQALVTEYADGAAIGWHRDKPVYRDVVGFSFVTTCIFRFRRRIGEKFQRYNVRVAPRSAYLLRGAARHEWYHSIPPLSGLRYSVTFRSLA